MSDYKTLAADGFGYLLFPAEGTATSMIVVLHGMASDAANMQRWIRSIREENKNADILSIEGPFKVKVSAAQREKHNIAPDRQLRSWFNTQGIWPLFKHLGAYLFNRLALFKDLNAFIDARLRERGLGDDRLIMAGLSLGGIVATHTALARPQPCGGLVAMSSAALPGLRTISRPAMFMGVGSKDHIFNRPAKKGLLSQVFAGVSLSQPATVRRLQKGRVPLDARVYADMPHIPTDEAYADSARFMAKRLG